MRYKQRGVTIQDVARTAGVSVTTASRVLNNKDDVAPETYEKVRRVMQELNYTASLAAKGMRSRVTKVIGLVVPGVADVFYQEIIKGVGAGIQGSGYDLMIYTSERPSTNHGSWEQEHVSLLSSGLTDGCIVVTPSAPAFPPGARIVVIDPQGAGAAVPSVLARNMAGALSVMEYLAGLGHQRIGFIGGRPDALSAMRRREGYIAGLATAGLPFNTDWAVDGDYTQERGQEAAHYLLGLAERPTAIFAANDKMAFGVMDAAREMGLRIPEDLSVVGFDNLPEAAQVTPRLTTVDQSIQEMGRRAVKLLFDVLSGATQENTQIRVPTRLIVRDSCAPPVR